jgi:predicted  nucleic acid-binding Zn-ribbon protein
VEARLEEIQATLEDSTEIARHRKLLEERERQLNEARRANSRAEHSVQSVRTKLDRSSKKLYGGSVRNPKELEDLQAEVESLSRYLSSLEDELLEAMVALDDATEAFSKRESALEKAKSARAAENADLMQEQSTLLAQKERLQDELEVTKESLPPSDLEIYRNVKSRSGGLAISTLEDGSCSACGLTIPPSKQQQVRSQSEYVRCSQCGRILYAR